MKTTAALLALSLSLLVSSCTTCPLGHKSVKAGGIEHVVLIWLKNPGNPSDRAAVIASANKFRAEIPEVLNLSVGTALPSDRPVVDDSFDVGLVIRFADQAALSRYEKSAIHQQAVKDTLKPVSKKLLVYDIVTQ